MCREFMLFCILLYRYELDELLDLLTPILQCQ